MSRKRLAEIYALETIFDTVVELEITERWIECEILNHFGVGVQLDAGKAEFDCPGFDEFDQAPPDTPALFCRGDRNIFEVDVIRAWKENDKTADLSVVDVDMNPPHFDCSGEVCYHRCGFLTDTFNVFVVRGRGALVDAVEILFAGFSNHVVANVASPGP